MLNIAFLMLKSHYRRFGIFRVWMTVARTINVTMNRMMAAKSRRIG